MLMYMIEAFIASSSLLDVNVNLLSMSC